MAASLIVISGSSEGDYYPLDPETLVVGRDEKCAIQVIDELVSRRHMQVRCDEADQSYHALDMDSVNGVGINGRRISAETALADGDVIQVGNSKLIYFSRDFPDRKSAWDYYKLCGESGKSTLIR